MNMMKPKKDINTVPTVGFTEETFNHKGVQFNAIDMSGQGKYRNLWEQYYTECEGVIFVIDSTDKLRFAVAKDELDMMLEAAPMQGKTCPILIFANKMDLPGAAHPTEVMAALELERIQDKPWNIMASDAIHNDGVEPGIKWLIDAVKRVKAANAIA
jgi:ADP-ribosylation factor-like protein 6